MLPYHLNFPQEISLATFFGLSMTVIIIYSFSQNLRWRHNRFQTLMRCYRDIFNFSTFIFCEIDLLGTCYIHTGFQACSICRTAELEIPIPIFPHQCYKLHLKLLQKQMSKTLLQLNLKMWEFQTQKVKFLQLKPKKFICYQNISIFPKPTYIQSTCKCQHFVQN